MMGHKVSIYLDEETHRHLKTAASQLGLSLSEFMARAALNALRQPHRHAAAEAMDHLRRQIATAFSVDEIRSMRDCGRL
ncbi:MAG: ribbon-helix-helix domain-containing protein [Chloroflexi bacterium]|nr:ribbon-helix-helix domain-containing protein [Chloroflexota bacterium]